MAGCTARLQCGEIRDLRQLQPLIYLGITEYGEYRMEPSLLRPLSVGGTKDTA